MGGCTVVARGDAAWDRRADGEIDGRPQQGPITEAVGAYERALDARPDSIEAHWKLLRALHFAGDFASGGDPAGRPFDRAREVSDTGIAALAQRIGSGRPLDEMEPGTFRSQLDSASVPSSDVARLYFWSAINWGAWSRTAGLLRTVQQGVANRIHRYALVALELEPDYDGGGVLRLLGRLHATLPRVPFVSGWVDRDRAIPLVERAHAMAPEHPGNRLLLALTLLDLAPERREEALALLREVEGLTPRASMRIEDLAIREQARERLASEAMRSA